MTKKGERIVILGAGFAGLTAALKVAAVLPSASITLIDKREFHTYTPWLYELVTGIRTSPEKLKKAATVELKELVLQNKADNVHVVKQEVAKVDVEGKQVIFKNGKTRLYDRLVIALGSAVSFFDIPGVKEFAMSVKYVDQALAIRERIDDVLKHQDECHLVIVGAGPTGTESAGEIANFINKHPQKAKIQTLLIDAGPDILMNFPPVLRFLASRRLKKLGVKIWVNTMLTKATRRYAYVKPRPSRPAEEPVVSSVEGQTRVKYDVLVWAGGVRPTKVVQSLALPQDEKGRIKVLPTLQVEGHPDIFAAGDAISLRDPRSERLVPAAAWSAIGEAEVLARNLAGGSAEYRLPKKFPAIISVGGKYSVASLFGIPIFGRVAFFIRRLVDLNYFRKILPLRKAWKHWRSGVRVLGKND